MEALFIFLMVISTPILGMLCLLVIEYQNHRTRRWDRLWSELRPPPPSHPPPIRPRKDPPIPSPTPELIHRTP